MKEGRKQEYPEKTPSDELQKMPHDARRSWCLQSHDFQSDNRGRNSLTDVASRLDVQIIRAIILRLNQRWNLEWAALTGTQPGTVG